MTQTLQLKTLLPFVLAAALFPSQVLAQLVVPVKVTNLPATQVVSGTVNVGNTVPVTVTNLPATQAVTGTVNVGNPVQISGPVTVTGSVEATIARGSVSATLAPGAVVGINNGTSYQMFTESKNANNVVLPNPATAGQQLVIDSLFITVSDFGSSLPPNPMMGVLGTHKGNSGLQIDYSLLVPCLRTGDSTTSYTASCNLLQTGIVLPPGETLLVNGLTFGADLAVMVFGRIVAAS